MTIFHSCMLSAICPSDLYQKPDMKSRSASKPMQPEDYQRIEQDLHDQLQEKRQSHHEIQHKVDLWNANFDSYGNSDEVSHHSSGTEYDSILGDDGDEKFFSMTSPHDMLPPLEEPKLPVDMMAGGVLLPARGFPGIAAGSFPSAAGLASNSGYNYTRFGSAKVAVPGKAEITQLFTHPNSQSVSQSVNQSVSQSVSQSLSCLLRQTPLDSNTHVSVIVHQVVG